MIVYLATAAHTYTIRSYLWTWGLPATRRIKVLTYESLPQIGDVDAQTWIFSDLDRLSPAQKDAACVLWDRLSKLAPRVRLMNDPRRVMVRYELLQRLHELGVNAFQAYPLAVVPSSLRFPVFLREASEHSGPASQLLDDHEALDRAAEKALASGCRADDLLVVEFCDTSDDGGVFRKYGAFLVGGRIVPRHLLMSRDWMVNVDADRVDPRKLAEERLYLDENPHRTLLERLFRLASIDYGRIDYSFLDGRPQVWEINTNPAPVLFPWECKVRRLPNHWRFARAIGSAFKALDTVGETFAK